MAKILLETQTDTFLLYHSAPILPTKKCSKQSSFRVSFSLCQLLLSQAGKGGGSTFCKPQTGGL